VTPLLLASLEQANPVPTLPNELEEIHWLERIQRNKDLERLNAEDGNDDAVVRLKRLRRDLEEGLELISPEVNHTDIEQWTFGQAEAKW